MRNIYLFFVTYFYRFLTFILPIFISKKSAKDGILFLENFPIENAGYQYRAKKWVDIFNNENLNAEVVTLFEDKNDFEQQFKNDDVTLFFIKSIRKRFKQCLYARKFHAVVVRRELLMFNDYGNLFMDKFLLKIHQNVILDFDDFLFRGNHIHTPSVVFRAKNIENFILPNVVTGDYFLHLHNAYNGKIKRFEAKMAAYRVHLGGVFSLKQKNMSSKESFNFWRKQLNGYYHILKNYKLNLKQKRFINKAIYSLINILRIYAFQDNDISAAKQLALKQIKYTPKRGFNLKILIGAIASLIIPKYMAKRINTNKAKFS